jgi:acetyltransferase (GNAT) family protein
MSEDAETILSILSAEDIAAHLHELGALLHVCVHAGGAVNFVLPFTAEDSEAFWSRKVLPAVQGGGRVLWVALNGGRIVGSVQLVYDTPPNQPHRAEVTKLLVHPGFRRRASRGR